MTYNILAEGLVGHTAQQHFVIYHIAVNWSSFVLIERTASPHCTSATVLGLLSNSSGFSSASLQTLAVGLQ